MSKSKETAKEGNAEENCCAKGGCSCDCNCDCQSVATSLRNIAEQIEKCCK